jgi:hypothetical protein
MSLEFEARTVPDEGAVGASAIPRRISGATPQARKGGDFQTHPRPSEGKASIEATEGQRSVASQQSSLRLWKRALDSEWMSNQP